MYKVIRKITTFVNRVYSLDTLNLLLNFLDKEYGYLLTSDIDIIVCKVMDVSPISEACKCLYISSV